MSEHFTQQKKNEIIELYKTGNYSYTYLSKKCNVSKTGIARLLKRNGIKARDMNYTSEEQINEIIILFKTGKYTFVDLGKKFNLTGTQIGRLLHKRGIKARTLSEIFRKYPIKEDFFDEINTSEKSYVLGWLYSDGYNNIRLNSISLSLKETDKEILVKINNLIQPTKPLMFVDMSKHRERRMGFENSKDIYRMVIINKHISQRLVELGCGQAKTFTLTFPEWLNKDLIRHFLRGIMDGDGCICKDLKRPEVSLMATLQFCTRLSEILKKQFDIDVDIRTRHPERNNNIRQLRLKGGLDKMMIFLDWIYEGSTIYLERKYNLYMAMKEKQQSRIKPKLITTSI